MRRATPALPLRTVFRRFWPDTRGHRGGLALGTALVALEVPLEALAIWLFKSLVDRVLQPADFAAFPRIAAAYLGLTVAMGVVSFAAGQVLTRVSETFLLSVRTRLFAHLHRLSMDFFDRRPLGDLLSRLGGDVESVETLVLSGVSTAVSSGLRVIVYLVMLFVVDPTLAAGALVVSPLLWVINRFFSRRLRRSARLVRDQVGSLTAIAEESLSTVPLVQAYDRSAAQTRRFDDEGRTVVDTALRSARLHGIYAPLVELVELLGLMLVIGYGTWQLARHQLSLGTLLVFLAYFAEMYAPLQNLGQLGNAFYSAAAGAERIIEVLDARPGVRDLPQAEPLARARGLVEFRDVWFRYPGQAAPALRGVSFTAHPGQVVAVVGRSGSGKSTLAKLLLRFYDPDSGAVLLDGTDLRRLRLSDLRRNIAPVLQDTAVHDGTVIDNLLWGRPDAAVPEIIRAITAADVDTVAAELPDGLDSPVGYRGRLLSGGQRQRVSLGRAMIRDAPVLLLDEPTAALDPVAERRILDPLRRATTGRTAVLITHQLAAARHADLIIVLDRGQVVETGTHDHLIARRGQYHALWAASTSVAADPISLAADPISLAADPNPPTADPRSATRGPAAAPADRVIDLRNGPTQVIDRRLVVAERQRSDR